MKKKINDNNVDDQLKRLDVMEAQFDFYVDETVKIDKEVDAIDKDKDMSYEAREEKMQRIFNKTEELYVRYKKDLIEYDKLVNEIDLYFKNKYHIDLKLPDLDL